MRRWCGEKLNEAGLDQPTISAINRLPVLHAVTQFAAGVPLMDLWWQGSRPDASAESVKTMKDSVEAFGEFCRALRGIPVDGFGPIVRGADRKFAGRHQSLAETTCEVVNPILNPSADQSATHARIIEAGLPPDLYARLKGFAEIVASANGPAMLSHFDPHAGNFLYDKEMGKIIALDWDMAWAATPSQFLARIYGAHVYYSPDSDGEAKFNRIVEVFEPDAEQRRVLLRDTYALISLQVFNQLECGVAKDDGGAPIVNDAALQNAAKHLTRIISAFDAL
jgi:hypothetical protein